MLRPLRVRLHPETAAWGAGFALLEVGIASCLSFFGVGGGLTVAWLLVAAGIFAACEPGFCAWVWVMIAAHDEEEPPPEKPATDSAAGSPSEGSPPDSAPSRQEDSDPSSPSANSGPDPRVRYEERVARLIDSRSSNIVRAIEVLLALALAFLTYFSSDWSKSRMQPPDQAALQRSIDQLREDLKNCAQRVCGNNTDSDFGDVGVSSWDGGVSYLDPRFKQALVDALKEAANSSRPSWTNSSVFGISILVLLIIAIGLAIVGLIRKRPETAAPLGALGLAAGAIKEAEHLSRLDTTSYRIAEIAFLALLGAFVWLAWQKIQKTDHLVARAQGDDEQGKSKVESPLSLLFSSLVLLWALLVICYRHQDVPPKPSSSAVHQMISLPPQLLPSIYGFVPGKTDKLTSGKSLNEVAQAMMQQARTSGAQADDVLMLLGSADCTAVRKPRELSNNTLARERAEQLAGFVESMKVFSANHVIARSLYQSEKCTGSDSLRAVFPVLIKVEKTE